MSENIYNNIKDDIFGMFDSFSEQVLKDTAGIKEEVFKDHLTTRIQISCLRDDIQRNFASLRVEMHEIIKNPCEELWYQCDHMKFINTVDFKFKQFESNFEQYIYEPNHVQFEKEEFEDKSDDSDIDTKIPDGIRDIKEFLRDEV